MIYLALVTALGIGYAIGLMQNGIHIYHKENYHIDEDSEPNSSVGIDYFKEYYDETDGVNKF